MSSILRDDHTSVQVRSPPSHKSSSNLSNRCGDREIPETDQGIDPMPALDAAISRLAVKVAGVATDSQQWTAGSYIGCRALIHRPIAQRDFGSMQVSIENQNGADAVSLLDIRVDTVIGDLSDAVRLLSARPCGAIDNGTIASTEGPHSLMRTAFTQFASGQPVALTDLRGLTLALEQ